MTGSRLFPCLWALAFLACRGEAEAPRAEDARPALVLPPAPAAPSLPKPNGPFEPAKLRCDLLLPAEKARALLGFEPQLLQRFTQGDRFALVCTHRTQKIDEGFAFQVSCGKDQVPAAFARLHKLHEAAAGAHPIPIGKDGIATKTSCLLEHPHRPCFVEVTGRAAARQEGLLERLATQIAAAVP